MSASLKACSVSASALAGVSRIIRSQPLLTALDQTGNTLPALVATTVGPGVERAAYQAWADRWESRSATTVFRPLS